MVTAEVRISPASVLCILTQWPGGKGLYKEYSM